MAANGSVEDFEYVTQFFGFTPKSFSDGVYNAINDYIQECFKEMGTILEEEFAKNDNLSSSQIRSGCKVLIKKCYRNLDQFMDNMELYMLRNIFTIPRGVLLPEDEVHKEMKDECGNKTQSDIDLEILGLKDQIRKEILFKKMLQRQHEKLKEVLADRNGYANVLVPTNQFETSPIFLNFIFLNSLSFKGWRNGSMK